MAAGKKDEKVDKSEAPADDAAAAEKKQKKKKLFMFIGLGILLILLSVGSTVLILKLTAPKAAKTDESAESSSAAAEEPKEEVLPAIYFPLKPNFTVNFDVNGRQRFLQTELTLLYRDEKLKALIELHMPEVRNGLVMLLSAQAFDELQTIEGKEKLRAAALKSVQDIIAKESAQAEEKTKDKDKEKEKDKEKDKEKPKKAAPNVEQILFTQFVMQ